MQRVTIKTVAKEAGVAISAASVVLRNHPLTKRHSKETQKKILDAAARLGYKPDFFASQLRSKVRNVLMVWVKYLHDPYAATILEGFEERASERNYQILISVLRDGEDSNDVNLIGSQGISAVAMVGDFSQQFNAMSSANLIDENIHFVQIGREADDDRIAQVVIDPARGAADLVDHLCEQGMRDVWIMGYPAGLKHFDLRMKAFLDSLKRRNIDRPEIFRISDKANTPARIAEEATALIRKQLSDSKSTLPSAIIAVSDTLAYGAMLALSEKDIKVGRDIAVTGYDNIWTSQFSLPPLTTIDQRMREMGQASADLLIDMLEGNDKAKAVETECECKKVFLESKLVIRESSKIK